MNASRVYDMLTTESLAAVYTDLRDIALALSPGTEERDRIARQMQRIRVLLGKRGLLVHLTETGDGYHVVNFVPVVS